MPAARSRARSARSAARPDRATSPRRSAERSRYFTPENGARIDAIRDAIAADHAGSPARAPAPHEPDRGRRPSRLDHRRADGVPQAVGPACPPAAAPCARPRCLRGARLERSAATPSSWRRRSDRSTSPTSTRPTTSTGTSRTTTCGRRSWRGTRPRTTASPASASTAAIQSTRSAFNSRRTMPAALAAVIAGVDAELVVVSYNDEAWLTLDDLVDDVLLSTAGTSRCSPSTRSATSARRSASTTRRASESGRSRTSATPSCSSSSGPRHLVRNAVHDVVSATIPQSDGVPT